MKARVPTKPCKTLSLTSLSLILSQQPLRSPSNTTGLLLPQGLCTYFFPVLLQISSRLTPFLLQIHEGFSLKMNRCFIIFFLAITIFQYSVCFIQYFVYCLSPLQGFKLSEARVFCLLSLLLYSWYLEWEPGIQKVLRKNCLNPQYLGLHTGVNAPETTRNSPTVE